eukprot:5577875-Pleurochrysis_carterae.AAC.4
MALRHGAARRARHAGRGRALGRRARAGELWHRPIKRGGAAGCCTDQHALRVLREQRRRLSALARAQRRRPGERVSAARRWGRGRGRAAAADAAGTLCQREGAAGPCSTAGTRIIRKGGREGDGALSCALSWRSALAPACDRFAAKDFLRVRPIAASDCGHTGVEAGGEGSRLLPQRGL